MENFTDLIGLIQAEDHIAFFRRVRIVLCGQHHAYGSLKIPFGSNTIQFAVDCCFNQIHQIAIQTAHNRLGLRVAETAVEFDGIRLTVFINHQARV